MKIIVDLARGKLLLPDAEYPISNRVRSIRDGTRASGDIVKSLPDGLPYDPLPFPKGLWSVTGVVWQRDKQFDVATYGPVKITTDAWQMVNVWELDEEGDYLRETPRMVKDTCYWLHASVSRTTLGCIRLASPEDAVEIATTIEAVLGQGKAISLEVV
jgi:hypothetical protein